MVMTPMHLVHKTTGRVVRAGDHIVSFRGETYVLQEAERPRHAASTGRVYVTSAEDPDGEVRDYYPSVFDLEWRQA